MDLMKNTNLSFYAFSPKYWLDLRDVFLESVFRWQGLDVIMWQNWDTDQPGDSQQYSDLLCPVKAPIPLL